MPHDQDKFEELTGEVKSLLADLNTSINKKELDIQEVKNDMQFLLDAATALEEYIDNLEDEVPF